MDLVEKAKGGPFSRDPPMAEGEKNRRMLVIGQQRDTQSYPEVLAQTIPLWWHFSIFWGEISTIFNI
jgi:hypothetical protein